MPQTPRADGWQRYRKHRRSTVERWDSGETLIGTSRPGADSQYNPHLFPNDDAVQTFELSCYMQGQLIQDSGNRETRYFRFDDAVVGACNGVYTHYAFVECTSGFFHGRPISPQALRILGVTVDD
jgi:hypothetical protein